MATRWGLCVCVYVCDCVCVCVCLWGWTTIFYPTPQQLKCLGGGIIAKLAGHARISPVKCRRVRGAGGIWAVAFFFPPSSSPIVLEILAFHFFARLFRHIIHSNSTFNLDTNKCYWLLCCCCFFKLLGLETA